MSTAICKTWWKLYRDVGCVSASGVGDLAKSDATRFAKSYPHILIHHTISSGKHLISNSFIFRHDNDLEAQCQWSESISGRHIMEQHYVMDWPPQKPELNVNESMLKLLELNKRQPTSKNKSFEWPLRSLKNYSWRLLNEMTRKTKYYFHTDFQTL